jgi:glycosyltransferase involved in cell wall biosynthesis
MRIGIDYTAAVHQQAGIGRYTRGLVEALAKLDSEHEYVLFMAGGNAQTPGLGFKMPDNFRVRRVPLSERFVNIMWYRLRLPVPIDLFISPVDVFHSPNYVLPPLRRGMKVVTIHDLSFLRYPEGAEPSLRRYLSGAVPKAVRRADLVLADSDNTEQDIIELLGVAPGKVKVLHPGVGERFRPLDDEGLLGRIRELYGLSSPFLLSLGTLEPRKNLILLLDAYAALRARGDIYHKLVIAGKKGWLYEGIFRKVKELSLEEEVIFLGFVADENLPALYNLAEVFVFPSLYEGFGLPPLEAMACGTPVITSDSSSLPEVVGEAGLMVSSGDSKALAQAMKRVLDDPTLREDLAGKGVRQARKFTWQAAAQKALNIYEGLSGLSAN